MIRRMLLISSFVFATLSTSANADVVPSGISFNVSEDSVQNWGFSECYAKTSILFSGTVVDDIKDSCLSSEILFGVRDSKTKKINILASGEKDIVFNFTPYQSDSNYVSNWSGGVNWYFNEKSFGFTSSEYIKQRSADTNLYYSGVAGLSIHMKNSSEASSPWAYSLYNTTQVVKINSTDYEVVFFTKLNDVPIGLAIGGLGLLGLSFKRKKQYPLKGQFL